MKVLVTGASGFIGRACLRVFAGHEVLGTFKSHPAPGLEPVDLMDAGGVSSLVQRFGPDAIVHCAARPSVDWCEENPAEARRLNVDASLNLLRAAESVHARLAFISTDYVFDGEAGPYLEDAAVNPINAYGRLKLEVENALIANKGGHLIARTTNVYGYDYRSKNFLMALLPRLALGEKAAVAQDQFGTPIHVDDLCATIRLLLEREVEGVVHVAGPDYVNRVAWLRLAAQTFDLDESLVSGHETNQLAQPARRPLAAGLKTARLAQLGLPSPRGLSEGLAHMRAEKMAATEQAW
jgi:dTDP-4-dehydrorhamnose reductase